MRIVLAQVCTAQPMPLFEIGARFGNIAPGRFTATRQCAGLRPRRSLGRAGSVDANIVAKTRAITGRTHVSHYGIATVKNKEMKSLTAISSLDSGNSAPQEEGPVARRLRAKMQAAFCPTSLTIVDESRLHAGHSGARDSGESHFRVRIISSQFAGLSRVERQRRVYAAVNEEIRAGLHA